MCRSPWRVLALTLVAFAGCVLPEPDVDAFDVGGARQAVSSASSMFVRQGSKKCLDVAGGTDDGMRLVQWSCHGGANQSFRIEPIGGGAVRLVDQNSQKCVDVKQSGSADGTPIQIWGCNGTGAQSFAIEDAGNGYKRIRNTLSNKCVDVNHQSNDDGATVQLWSCNGSSAQNFQIVAHAGDAGDAGGTLSTSLSGSLLTMTTGSVRVEYDLSTGTADFLYGGMKRIAAFYAGVQLTRYITSRDYAERSYTVSNNQVVVTSRGDGLPTMQQLFNFDGGHRFLTRVVLLGDNLSTHWIAPLVMSTKGGLDIGSYDDARLLWVPFDNDAWVSYNAASINDRGTSFEVAAFYDNASRNGIVVGSVLHDTWKTGVYYDGSNNRLDALNVFGGVSDATWTHDAVPHAEVTGNALYSPMVFVGYGPDFRDLLEEYADVNAFYENKLSWSGGVPFGWNSWGKIQSALSYDKAIQVSDFFRNALQGSDFQNQGTVYINLDSYWDNLSEAQLAQFVAHARSNGQKAGIYWAPFADWGSYARQVEGSSYNYEQIWLRDGQGKPIQLDGATAVDPTHPGTKQRIDYYIDRFKRLGFEYVKLDFLTHGALESTVRYSSSARTGIQAYNEGMRYVRDRIAGSMFISESIAPLFPHQYAHARRVSCDTYGAARGFASSEYELNSASYGFWMSGRLYQYNDPDYSVLEGFSPAENMTRVIATAISGTVFLNGDDLTSSNAQALARTYLTNSRINAVARMGRAFRPVEGNTGTKPSELFILQDGGSTYVAVFNFGGKGVSKTVDFARLGLDGSRVYNVTDLWTGQSWSARGDTQVVLDKDFARLLRLE
jgi:hypothetical protein